MAVSDREIAESLDLLFRETNPNSFTSFSDVVQRLQSKLGFDLSSKIDFIRAQITLMFSTRTPPPPQPSQPLPPQPQPPMPPQQQHTMTTTTTTNSNPIFRGTPSPAASHFGHNFGMPRGATEINFAQPGLRGGDVAAAAAAGNVVIDSAQTKESTQARPKRRGGAGGLNKLCGVSPELQAIVGQPAMPRTEIVRQLWAYIRKNNLQDPNNKRKIICNDELRLVFETDCTDMFQMNKLLAKHITRLDPTKEITPKAKKLKVEESSEVTHTEVTKPNPVVISEALAKFFGASGKEMLQSEVFQRFDEYIKVNGLEDPLNSIVVCDAKLQELFGSESIPAEGRYEMLARHHIIQQS